MNLLATLPPQTQQETLVDWTILFWLGLPVFAVIYGIWRWLNPTERSRRDMKRIIDDQWQERAQNSPLTAKELQRRHFEDKRIRDNEERWREPAGDNTEEEDE